MAQNSNAPRSQEDYITQVSEEIEGRVTNKLSQEFSRMESRILGALSGLDDFFMNPLIQGHSGTAPETSQNSYVTNQATNEDGSQSDPHPEASIFQSQTTRNSGPKDGHDIHPVYNRFCLKHLRSKFQKLVIANFGQFWLKLLVLSILDPLQKIPLNILKLLI